MGFFKLKNDESSVDKLTLKALRIFQGSNMSRRDVLNVLRTSSLDSLTEAQQSTIRAVFKNPSLLDQDRLERFAKKKSIELPHMTSGVMSASIVLLSRRFPKQWMLYEERFSDLKDVRAMEKAAGKAPWKVQFYYYRDLFSTWGIFLTAILLRTTRNKLFRKRK